MSTTLQADEKGNLHVPSSLLPNAEPMATYHVHEQNGQILISKELQKTSGKEPFWKTATPKERVKAFDDWVKNLPPGPGLSEYAVSRENMYD